MEKKAAREQEKEKEAAAAAAERVDKAATGIAGEVAEEGVVPSEAGKDKTDVIVAVGKVVEELEKDLAMARTAATIRQQLGNAVGTTGMAAVGSSGLGEEAMSSVVTVESQGETDLSEMSELVAMTNMPMEEVGPSGQLASGLATGGYATRFSLPLAVEEEEEADPLAKVQRLLAGFLPSPCISTRKAAPKLDSHPPPLTPRPHTIQTWIC